MYSTLNAANIYFDSRLHSTVWFNDSNSNRTKALYKATTIVDSLNYKGRKATVYTVLEADSDANQTTIRAAEAAQTLEFPRDGDSTVLEPINIATYEIAFALLDGIDPDIEIDSLAITTQQYAGVKTAYNRSIQQIEHIVNGVPSATAWRILRPFLRDSFGVKLSRI